MTLEEAKMFLDNLKVCVGEHPVVADWLVEIADRKTENSSEIPNNCEDEPQTYITEDRDTQILDAWQVNHRNTTSVENEPQTDCLEQFRVGLEHHTDTTHFGKAKGESITTNKVETEPQTERSSE